VHAVEIALEGVELPIPERAVELDPAVDVFERLGVERQFVYAPTALAAQQPGALEHAQMP
jgi:hypothetical protein